METIGSRKIWTFSEKGIPVARVSSVIRNGDASPVRDYMELATKVAELQFRNRDFVLMFRGQEDDYRNRSGNTTIKPTLMRAATSKKVPSMTKVQSRFSRLEKAEAALVEQYKAKQILGRERLERQRILRWSILQHYEICDTPLLDVTHSLRIAASFASERAQKFAYVLVLGVPHISGAITASAEAGLQIVRLASVCPPSAVRPHIQEGYLLGEYPDFSSVEQKGLYKNYEVDFGRRLIAKFRFEPDQFWEHSGSFPRVPHKALYPRSADDPMCELAEAVKMSLADADQ